MADKMIDLGDTGSISVNAVGPDAIQFTIVDGPTARAGVTLTHERVKYLILHLCKLTGVPVDQPTRKALV